MKLTKRNGTLIAEGGYRAGFAEEARALGGQWDPYRKVWSFDERRLADVRALGRKYYGAVLSGARGSLAPRQAAYSDLTAATREERKAQRSQRRTELLSARTELMSQIDEINAQLAAL